jgi:AcrR family transcriptional regulator
VQTGQPLDRRKRRSLATSDAIRRAALELVAEHGLEQVSVEQIAERADVGYRTFFNHFGCKEDALVESGDSRALELTEALDQRPAAESPLEALRAVLLVEAASVEDRETEFALRFTVLEANPVLMRRFHAEFAVLDRALVESLARRLHLDPDRDLYPHLLAAVGITALRTSFLRWRAAKADREPLADGLVELVSQAFDMLAAGLPAPVGPDQSAAARPASTVS